MKKLVTLSLLLLSLALAHPVWAQKKQAATSAMNAKTFADIKLRNIGPAFMSGRIADIAVSPDNQNIWYVGAASGGVWKTENSGTTWKPIFDKEPVFSIGCITIDPNNSHTIWVGTGENNGGRHLSFGDGIYRSIDDGKTWKNMGIKKSEHISKIIVHPSNPDIIWVASQGPLWSSGGQRGLYKSTDGGKTWKRTLGDDQWTGVTDMAIDPRNPNRIYAATWQRHRTVAAYMGGGFKTAIYRSEDGGETWKKITNGLPKSKMGKIGIAISPQKPDVIYAAIELERRKGGVFKSTNRGESWTKQSDAVAGGTGSHYYNELYASPHKFDRIYLCDVRMQISENGGKTFKQMKEINKHSDNHALVFRTNDPNYLLVGTDGGLYESFDLAQNWRFINNLPLTQFYKLAIDDAKPFYWIYGGTQDNNTQGGPSRTDNYHGISNSDWEVVLFADGYQPATEPGNPNIMYAEWQQGNLVRIDRTTGEFVYIQPQAREGEPYERFNWDTPILVSPHSPTRLYYASYRVWRSDNRGDDWKPISGDLTQTQERLNKPIMGKKQSWDSPWDVYAMSAFNTITSLAESPKKEGLLYAGTDDGLIQVTEDGGVNWHKIPVANLPNAPKTAFVNDIKADLFDANTVYICLDNHKTGDYKAYMYKSTNRGKTWQSISGNLPSPLIAWRIVQDYVNPKLLFVGTEFGIYFTLNGGNQWIKLNTGANISFRDLAIQRRENDLVGASFGRGFFIFDDYSFLRKLNEKELQKNVLLFPSRKAWWYIQRGPLGRGAKGSQGQSYFTAPNPPFGANFTYYLKDDLKSLKQIRQEKEKLLIKANQNVNFPGWKALDKEIMQPKPQIILTILDKDNNLVKNIVGSTQKGFHRINWDLTFASPMPIRFLFDKRGGEGRKRGFMVAPGKYKTVLSQVVDGVFTVLSDTVAFDVEQLRKGALKGADAQIVAAFWKQLSGFQANASALYMNLGELKSKAKAMQKALLRAPRANADLSKEIYVFYTKVNVLQEQIYGSPAKAEVGENQNPTIMERLSTAMMGTRNSTYGPAAMHKKSFELAQNEYKQLSSEYSKLNSTELRRLENELKTAGAPYIQGEDFPGK